MKKLLPYSLMCVDAIEKWLNEMAMEGNHLVKMNSLYATFEKGEPADTKYSLVFHPTERNRHLHYTYEPELDIYHEYGWKLIQKDANGKNIEIGINNRTEFLSLYKSIIDNPTKDIQRDILKLEYLAKPTFERSYMMFGLSMLLFSVMNVLFSPGYLLVYYHTFVDRVYSGIISIIPFTLLFVFLICKAIRFLALRRYYKGKRRKLKRSIKPHLLFITFSFILCLALGMYANANIYSKSINGTYLGDIDNLVNLRVAEGEYSIYLPENVLDDYYYGYSKHAPFLPMRYSLLESATTTEEEYSRILISVVYTKSDVPYHLEKVFEYHTPSDEEVFYSSTSYFDEIMYFERDYWPAGSADLFHYSIFFHNEYELLEIQYDGRRTPEEIIANVERLYSEE